MRIPISLLFFICLSTNLLAQSHSPILKHRWVAKFSPANTIDPITPSLQIGLEHKLNSKSSIQVELGHILASDLFYRQTSDSAIFPNHQGTKIRLEYRRNAATIGFVNDLLETFFNSNQGFYLAAEMFHTTINYNSRQAYFDRKEQSGHQDYGSDYYNATYYRVKIEREIYGLNVKFGLQRSFDHFVLDGYIGGGLRYRKVRHTGDFNKDHIWTSGWRHPTIWGVTEMPGDYGGIGIPLNIKVGYAF
ncbi:MAG: hypothetical protein H7Y13_01030 [Sphingobacteriaceae bacterium]|nr:hypothetical protein [Sphingobacteriaceae bacterium]